MNKISLWLILIFILGCDQKKPNPSEEPNQMETSSYNSKWSIEAQNSAKKRINTWQNLKVLDIDLEFDKAYIDPSFWESVDYKDKNEIMGSIIIYTELQKETEISSFSFFDKKSGKEIATYSSYSGFEIM